MRIKKIVLTISALVLIIGTGLTPAGAALNDVGPVDPANGFPIWYQDTNLLTLQLCLDGNGFCIFDPVIVGNVFSETIGFGAEAFWWMGDTALTFPGGDGLLVLGLEAAFIGEGPVAGDQIGFGRVRIRINVDQPGTYVVTHPFGTYKQVVTDAAGVRDINVSFDIGITTAGVFTTALGSDIGPFLFWDSELPQTDPGTVGAFYIGNPAIPHTVLGSPFGTNFFRIERDGVLVAETNLFTVQGKVFTGNGDTAPTAEPDTAATAMDTPVLIDVMANDTAVDIPINPTALTITNGPDGTAVMEVVGGKPMVRFTPVTGFSGDTSFTYTVASFTGLTSLAATVNLIVEDLRVNRAVLRPRLMKWQIQGTSSDTIANEITARLSTGNQSATLSGAQEVPPLTTDASGTATVTINEAMTAIDFTLNVQNILNIAAAHIHLGASGVDGQVIFVLSLTDFASPLTGTLTAADLQTIPTEGINTFADALKAILSGNAYINVHTTAHPGGEIRGQLGPVRLIGTAPVGIDGTWSINGLIPVRPDETGTISVESSNGIQVQQLPVLPR